MTPKILTPALAQKLADYVITVRPASREEWTHSWWSSFGDP